MRSYRELIRIPDFKSRFNYLRLKGNVGKETFGIDRYLNQSFYHSSEWRSLRHHIILRDNGCDLGIPGREIDDNIYIHHINPINQADLIHASDILTDPDNLICCSYATHNAIHYGDESLLILDPVTRRPNDTCPWR